jgi:hypothetical protein
MWSEGDVRGGCKEAILAVFFGVVEADRRI